MIGVRVCEACDQGFRPSRPDRRYCSAKCRLRAFRARNVPAELESVSVELESVSEKPAKRKPQRIDWERSLLVARAAREEQEWWW